MKRSEIYLKAAELIAQNRNVSNGAFYKYEGACDVLSCGSLPYSFNQVGLRIEFRDIFLADKHGLYIASDEMGERDAQDWRVTALLFMHAIALDEEKRK